MHLKCVLISSLIKNTLSGFNSLAIYQERGLYQKRDRNNHAYSDEQPIPRVAEKLREYETIL